MITRYKSHSGFAFVGAKRDKYKLHAIFGTRFKGNVLYESSCSIEDIEAMDTVYLLLSKDGAIFYGYLPVYSKSSNELFCKCVLDVGLMAWNKNVANFLSQETIDELNKILNEKN